MEATSRHTYVPTAVAHSPASTTMALHYSEMQLQAQIRPLAHARQLQSIQHPESAATGTCATWAVALQPSHRSSRFGCASTKSINDGSISDVFLQGVTASNTSERLYILRLKEKILRYCQLACIHSDHSSVVDLL
jgi:hypothetical protein